MSEHHRWKPGYAKRMADISARSGLPLVPWQQGFLQRIENHDVDLTFHEIVRDLNE